MEWVRTFVVAGLSSVSSASFSTLRARANFCPNAAGVVAGTRNSSIPPIAQFLRILDAGYIESSSG
ncbi:MAG: hypothetical protein ACREHD_28875, partial [Pirellulales bacterium]